MTKQLKESVHHKTRFLTELVQSGLIHSKLAAKQPKRPNCTKAENHSKTLKKAKKMKIVWEWFLGRNIKTHFFLTKNKFFDQTALISV